MRILELPRPHPSYEKLYRALLTGDVQVIKDHLIVDAERLAYLTVMAEEFDPEVDDIEDEDYDEEIDVALFAVLYCPIATIEYVFTKANLDTLWSYPVGSYTNQDISCNANLASYAALRRDPELFAFVLQHKTPEVDKRSDYGVERTIDGHSAVQLMLTGSTRKPLCKEDIEFLTTTLETLFRQGHKDKAIDYLLATGSRTWKETELHAHPKIVEAYPHLRDSIDEVANPPCKLYWYNEQDENCGRNYNKSRRNVAEWLQKLATAYLKLQLGRGSLQSPPVRPTFPFSTKIHRS